MFVDWWFIFKTWLVVCLTWSFIKHNQYCTYAKCRSVWSMFTKLVVHHGSVFSVCLENGIRSLMLCFHYWLQHLWTHLCWWVYWIPVWLLWFATPSAHDRPAWSLAEIKSVAEVGPASWVSPASSEGNTWLYARCFVHPIIEALWPWEQALAICCQGQLSHQRYLVSVMLNINVV